MTDKGYPCVLSLNHDAIVSMTQKDPQFMKRIDELGILSAEAQMLTVPITNTEKLIATADQGLIAYCEENNPIPIGYAKFGTKDLFFYRKDGKVVECRGTPCLLDIYVDQTHQRRGIGKALFIAVMQAYDVEGPHKLAYDRPSPKLTAFLSRHYPDLGPGDLQPNRYHIFPSKGFHSALL